MSLYRPGGETPSAPARNSGYPAWLINGFRADLLVWSPEEWEGLDPKPADAQAYPNGIRAVLRMA